MYKQLKTLHIVFNTNLLQDVGKRKQKGKHQLHSMTQRRGPSSYNSGMLGAHLNPSLLVQLFKHPNVILRGPTRRELNVE